MKPLSYDDARLVPLLSDADIEHRVSDLIGRAKVRQLWLLFLNQDNIQLPFIMPIEGHPTTPSVEDTGWMGEHLHELCETGGAAQVVIVIERYASASLTPQDIAWAKALHDACDGAGMPLRAVLLSHRTGIRPIAQDDYRFG